MVIRWTYNLQEQKMVIPQANNMTDEELIIC